MCINSVETESCIFMNISSLEQIFRTIRVYGHFTREIFVLSRCCSPFRGAQKTVHQVRTDLVGSTP